MGQELATQQQAPAATSAPALILPATTAELSSKQRGWLQLAAVSEQTQGNLQRYELEIQQIVKDALGNKDSKSVTEVLKAVKAKAAEAKDCRLQFTRLLDEKLISRVTAFEKRNDEVIAPLVNHELELRKEAVRQAGQIAQKNQEVADLRLHIENEHARRGTKYRKDLAELIVEGYKTALGTPVEPKKLPEYLQQLRGFLQTHKLDGFRIFQRRFVSDAEAKDIYGQVKAYDSKPDLNAALIELEKQFSMYEQDLQNAQAAIKQADEQKEAKQKQEDAALQTEQQTNTLIAQANVAQVNGPVIKKRYELKEENTEEWALVVVSHFVAGWNYLKTYLNNRKWTELKVSQMGAALAKYYSETGKPFNGLQFVEVEK